jgi:tetratricopeptide (TPR) repeat protein
MAMDDMSAERSAAYYKLREAEQEAHKGHLEKALGLARDALQEDPDYLEARFWIAAQYEAMDELRKASHEYQDIIHRDHENEEAWARLRAIDPDAAERMQRLQEIAPDPFVVQREHPEELDEDLDDLGSLMGEQNGETEDEGQFVPLHDGEEVGFDSLEEIEGTDGVAALVEGLPDDQGDDSDAGELGALDEADDEGWSLAAGDGEGEATADGGAAGEAAMDETVGLLDDGVAALYEDELPTEEVETGAAESAAATARSAGSAADGSAAAEAGAAGRGGGAAGAVPPWLHEEDMKYRRRLDNIEQISLVLPKIIEYWGDDDAWDTEISSVAHLDTERHREILEINDEVSARFGTPPWKLFMSPERRLYCTITRGEPPTLVITTGTLNNLERTERVFLCGRLTGFLTAGHLPYLQAVNLVLERSPLSITDVEADVLELTKTAQSGWDVGLNREARMKLGALCHAWQLRAELSADRAGYICCGNLEASVNVIARSVWRDPSQMQTVTWRRLLEKFKNKDLAQLADIPPKEDPIRDEGYGVYRIQMLRWWATTPAARALVAPA